MIATAKRLASVQEYYFSRKLREVSQMIQQGHPVSIWVLAVQIWLPS